MRQKSPPRIASWLLARMLDPHICDPVLGDLEERFHYHSKNRGYLPACLDYFGLVFSFIPSFIKNSSYWSGEMFRNYFKFGLRNIGKHKGYSFINIAGLAVGLALFILIALYIQFELGFDRFHTNRDRIYRVEQILAHDSGSEPTAGCPTALSQALLNDIPDFAGISRVIGNNFLITTSDNQKIKTDGVFAVDNSFLEMFSFPLIKGDVSSALIEPYSLVITETLATRIFGSDEPLGQVVRVDNSTDFTITGVIANIPLNSHLRFNALWSVSTFVADEGKEVFSRWRDNWVPLYVMLGPNQSLQEVNSKLRFFLKKYQGERSRNELYLRPLSKIHLYADVSQEFAIVGSIKNVNIFAAISLFILLIASINFMNLSTARSADRAREVGLKKVVGAQKTSLVKQFLGESVLTVLLSMVLAVLMAMAVLPEFNQSVNRKLDLNFIQNWPFTLGLLLLAVGVGLLAGFYPAFVLSSFRPIQVLRGRVSSGARNIFLRKFLVVFQFSISIGLIISAAIILQQNDFLLSKDLGYDSDQTLVIPLSGNPQRTESFRSELLKNPNILNAGIHDYLPHSSTNWCTVGWEGAGPDDSMKMNVNYVDENFIPTYEMTVTKGRAFTSNMRTWEDNAVIINETAADSIGWENPIGKRLLYNIDYKSRTVGGATVVGVVKDYHFLSLHHTIGPIMLRLFSEKMTGWTLSAKITGQDVPRTIAFIKNRYQRMFPDGIFEFRFLDQDIDLMYQEEQKAGRVILYLAVLGIFIACLGLFGLSSYATKQRTKEIGIRRIVGASVSNIMFHLTRDFMKLVILANALAWPAAYFTMSEWLKHFPYRTEIHWPVFVFAAGIALLIAFATVAYQASWAARANPTDSLRYE